MNTDRNGQRDRRLVLYDKDDPPNDLEPGEITVQFESQSQIRPLAIYVEQFLAAIGLPFAFVSNVTKLSDFTFQEARPEVVSKKLGIIVQEDDFVWQIAERLREKADGS